MEWCNSVKIAPVPLSYRTEPVARLIAEVRASVLSAQSLSQCVSGIERSRAGQEARRMVTNRTNKVVQQVHRGHRVGQVQQRVRGGSVPCWI